MRLYVTKNNNYMHRDKYLRKAGAELCQAQGKLGLSESDLVIQVIFQL